MFSRHVFSWSVRKCCYNHIFIELLSRTLNYQEVYLSAYDDGWEAEISLGSSLRRFCYERPHNPLESRTPPHEVYTQAEPCSSRPGFLMTGIGTVQEKHPPQFLHLSFLSFIRSSVKDCFQESLPGLDKGPVDGNKHRSPFLDRDWACWGTSGSTDSHWGTSKNQQYT